MRIDHVILVCKGCGGERRIDLDKPLTTAEEVKRWIDTRPTPCGCGASHCDVKLHLASELP